jgi:hypothetical protein
MSMTVRIFLTDLGIPVTLTGDNAFRGQIDGDFSLSATTDQELARLLVQADVC